MISVIHAAAQHPEAEVIIIQTAEPETDEVSQSELRQQSCCVMIGVIQPRRPGQDGPAPAQGFPALIQLRLTIISGIILVSEAAQVLSGFLLQQLEIITPFQLYFNPDLILKNYQVPSRSFTFQ